MNVAVLLSGGVDSAVVVHRLKEQGIDPTLFYIRIGMNHDKDTSSTKEDIKMSEKIKVLLSEEEVDSRIKQIAAKISKDYAG